MALFVASAFVGNAGAQTDVTSTYLQNPSFELSEEGINLTKVQTASNSNTLSMYGWTQNLNGITNFNNTELVDNATKASNSNHSDPVDAKEGSYHLFFRRSWNNSSTKDVSFTSNSANYPKGKYSVTFSYILEEGTSKGNTTVGSYLTIKALSGETEKGTIKLEAHNYGYEKYDYTDDWKESTLTFTLSEETELTIAAILTPRGGNKTELHLDNFVIKYSNTGVNELKALIAKANGLNSKLNTLSENIIAQAQEVCDGINHTPEYQNAIDNAIATLQSEIDEKWAAYELNPEGDDVTCLFINTGFDEDINFTVSSEEATVAATTYQTLGWTSTVGGNCTGATIGYGYEGTINGGNATVPATNSDGTTEGGALFICVGWSGTVIYKSLPATLAAGSYTITYKAYNGNTANTGALDIIPLIGFVPEEGDAIISSTTESFANQQWVEKTYTFTLSEATKGQIQIGMQPTTNTYSYNAPELFIDKITLTYYNPSIKALIDAVEKAKNATSANVGEDAFQHPQAAADILNSTREEAEGILANASDIVTIEEAVEALNNAIEEFEAVELNAPNADVRYAIQTAANWVDFTRNNKDWDHLQDTYFTYLADDRGDHGYYNIKLGFGKKDYLAQAFVFEAVDDVANGYKLYQTDKDGNARYISTGVLYGGNDSQIRTTTEADKALVFQVVATEIDGVYNLYNTKKGANLCPQDEGAYCSSDYPEMDGLRFVAVSKAEVTLKVTNLGWATLMLPFNAEIPAGLEVWSCTGEENGVLSLEAVESIAANTPYVVSSKEGEYTFADYGLAKQDKYAGTMLTGTYAAADAPVGSYVLQNGVNGFGFYKVADGKRPTVGAYRCYINASESAAPMFSLERGEGTTSIEDAELTIDNVVIYDLQGRRVEKMEKGLYIVNGRKVIVK